MRDIFWCSYQVEENYSIAGNHQVTQTLRMVELYFLRLDNLPDKKQKTTI